MRRLEPYRMLDIRNQAGIPTDHFLYQMREDGENRWIFLAHGREPEKPDSMEKEKLTITVPGIWRADLYDALSGNVEEIPVFYKENRTVWEITSYACDSFLYCLKPGRCTLHKTVKATGRQQAVKLPESARVTLEEDNVLPLDMAEFRLDDGEWREKEEILRLDNQIREELGYPRRADAYAQPWIYGKQEYEHRVSLRFHINSEIDITDARLALENADITEVFWNNRKIEDPAEGYYVDKQIRTVKLDGVKAGGNILEVHIPYHANVNVEAMYLLGDFGVKVRGCTAVLTEPVRELAFGDICTQGLPFYGGNLTLHMPVEIRQDGMLSVWVTKFRSPLIEVTLNGTEKRKIFKSPCQAEFEGVKKAAVNWRLRYSETGKTRSASCITAAIHRPGAGRMPGGQQGKTGRMNTSLHKQESWYPHMLY